MTQERNTFATAFMVGYALPDMMTSLTAHRQPKPPLHMLSVREVCFTKRKMRVKIKAKSPQYALSLLAGVLHPSHDVDSQTKEELQWELKLHKPIKLKIFSLGSFNIHRYLCPLMEFEQIKPSADLFPSMEKTFPAPLSNKASESHSKKQASHKLERRSLVAVNAFKTSDCKMENVRPTGLPSRSPDEIQDYMRKKNQLRSKEKREAHVRAQAATAARKEKMKMLEMERRARLHMEVLNGKERMETRSRPQWDSSVSASASTSEVNGPWSRSSYPVPPVDFPLPKPIDGDGLSFRGLESKSSWLHAEGPQGKLEVVNISRQKSQCQQELKDIKVCSSDRSKSRSFSPVQSLKDGTKKMKSLSLIMTNLENNQHSEHIAGQPLSKIFPNDVPKHTLFQQAYDTESSTPLSSGGDGTWQSTPLLNKQKESTYTLTNRKLQFVERKLKMLAKIDGLHHETQRPVATMVEVKESMPCQTQYLTYHLEKFPSWCKREALTEKKRVALLKVLAQQLVIRLDAAESHPSYLLDGNVQEHALSLRHNLEKFQKELHAAVKALEDFYSQPSRKKSTGYIVLPSKLEKKRGSQQEGSNLWHREVALNDQDALLYRDLSSEATSATSFLINFPISQEAKKDRQQRLRSGDSPEHKCLVSCKESKKEYLQAKTPDSMFQELELRLQSMCADSRSDTTCKGKRTWDHQELDRELQKLDAEIKETKMRMARNLFSTHPLADTGGVSSPLSLSPRCSGDATPCLEGVWSVSPTLAGGMERLVDLPNLVEENFDYIHHAEKDEPMGASFNEKYFREFHEPIPEADSIQVNEKDVKNDVISKDEKGDMVSLSDHSGPHNLIADKLASHVARRDMSAFNKTLETSTADVNMEAYKAHPQVRRVEIAQLAPEPSNVVGLQVLFKEGIRGNQENLADSITEALLQELLDLELSDMLLHSQDAARSSQLRRMKKEVLKCANLKSALTGINAHGAGRAQLFSDDASRSPCTSVSPNPTSTQESPKVCIPGPLMTYEEFDHWKYHDRMAMTPTSPANGIIEIYREPFKVTSKRLVDKFVREIFEAQGLLHASALLELYTSGKTLSLILENHSVDERDLEEKLYGKMLLEALCECLDKKYLRFYLPTFFLFLRPCPEDPHLKQTVVSDVNEHADAACEGGFSLEYILEKSLVEENWKTPNQEMVEVILDISEHVIMETIRSLVYELIAMKQSTCSLQVSTGFMPKWEANSFLQLID